MKTWNGNNYSNRFGSYKLQCEALVHTKGVSTVMIYVPTLTQQHHNLLCGSVCTFSIGRCRCQRREWRRCVRCDV